MEYLRKIERIMQHEDENGEEKKLRRTVFHEIRDHPRSKLPDKERTPLRLMGNASILIGAGTETTARSLAVTVFYLIKNPEIGNKLRNELVTALPQRNSEISLPHLESLPYLVSTSPPLQQHTPS